MKKYSKEILMGGLGLVIVAGVMFWFIRYEPGAILKIIIVASLIIIGVVIYSIRMIRKRQDIQLGNPEEDEFTKLVKVYASSRAYFYSIGLWFGIYLFHTSFSNTEEMLGIGLLGSALIYGLSLWYYKKTGDFYEKQD